MNTRLEPGDREFRSFPPMQLDGRTLFEVFRFRFQPVSSALAAVRRSWTTLINLLMLGRLLGRLHAVGAMKAFQHAPR